MTVFKSGNLVVLKSGGPIMTVDAVHTDIFDDSKVTGVVRLVSRRGTSARTLRM